MQWYLQVLQRYIDFTGRATRTEYWMFALFNVIVSIALSIIGYVVAGSNGQSALSSLYSLAVLLPSLGVSVRRLHDTNRSGWWLLIAFVPVIGIIVLIVFLVQDSDPGENRYGPNPKGPAITPAPAA
jgi:uncharacterized membrane protein YhaH (DUF805 family)